MLQVTGGIKDVQEKGKKIWKKEKGGEITGKINLKNTIRYIGRYIQKEKKN
jgi:predicted Rdx family selenoprotein